MLYEVILEFYLESKSEAPFHLLLRSLYVNIKLNCFKEILLGIFVILAVVKQIKIKKQKPPWSKSLEIL